MQSYPLDLYTSPQRYILNKKSYNQCDEYLKNTFYGKTLFTSSSQKLNKYIYTYPQSSQIYKNSIKKILDIGKRLQDKYKGEKSLHSLYNYISQNSNKGQQKPIIGQKQQTVPLKIIAPQGSRVLTNDDTSAIVFPPPIVQVRPLSAPKPQIYHQPPPIITQTFIPPPTVYQPNQQLTSPTKVIYHEPIIRRNANPNNKIISVPLPPGQQIILKPRPVNIPISPQTYIQHYQPIPNPPTKLSYQLNPQPILTKTISQNIPRPSSSMSSNSYDIISISPQSTKENFYQRQNNAQVLQQRIQQQYRNYNRCQSVNKQNITNIDQNNPHNPLINLKKQQNVQKKSQQSQTTQNKQKYLNLTNKINIQLNQMKDYENDQNFDKELEELQKIRNMKKQKQIIKKMEYILQKYKQIPTPIPPPVLQPVVLPEQQNQPLIQSIVNKFTLPSIFKNDKQKAAQERIFPDNFYQIPKLPQTPQIQHNPTDDSEKQGQIMKFTKTIVKEFKQIFNL